ncbi:hypothetical protein [Psychrobacter aestuarii]|uniref:Barstar (barnase inhibitor) domain-containing protein n=1 Tax=Psychrobacter aestuarii TaxID=556327 RepID=A0ABP3FNT4_9GAMM|nr:hypothetical protein [Psychrobacter aestuarii]
MTLFEECREALKDDFSILDDEHKAITILNSFPVNNNYITWSEIEYRDYECMEDLISDLSVLHNKSLYVIADSHNMPVFKSNLELIIENIYDVSALSPKVLIFNEEVLMEPLFPSYTLRVGLK